MHFDILSSERKKEINESLNGTLYFHLGKPVTYARILKALIDRKIAVYICGGAPRDWILGKKPNDIDFGVGIDIPELKEVLENDGLGDVSHLRFVNEDRRVMVWGIDGNQLLDFSVLKDPTDQSANTPRRAIGTIYTDHRMRDFTINALYLDPVQKNIFDPSGRGLRDLSQKKLEIVGEIFYLTSFRLAKFASLGYFFGDSAKDYLLKHLREDLESVPKDKFENFIKVQIVRKKINTNIFISKLEEMAKGFGCTEDFEFLVSRSSEYLREIACEVGHG